MAIKFRYFTVKVLVVKKITGPTFKSQEYKWVTVSKVKKLCRLDPLRGLIYSYWNIYSGGGATFVLFGQRLGLSKGHDFYKGY